MSDTQLPPINVDETIANYEAGFRKDIAEGAYETAPLMRSEAGIQLTLALARVLVVGRNLNLEPTDLFEQFAAIVAGGVANAAKMIEPDDGVGAAEVIDRALHDILDMVHRSAHASIEHQTGGTSFVVNQ